jgi:hypothetical protein
MNLRADKLANMGIDEVRNKNKISLRDTLR